MTRARRAVLFLSALALAFLFSAESQIMLELDPDFSPPAVIPTDPKDLVYSAPANDHMLQPIIVKVKHPNGSLVTEGPVQVVATTILSSNNGSNDNSGDWYTGELCRHSDWTNRLNFDRYLNDGGIEYHCNNSDPEYPLGKVVMTSSQGLATFPRLVHTKPFNDTRCIRFFASYGEHTANITTNAFRVDLAAAMLNITSSTPDSLFVNEPFTFTVQTLAEDPDNNGSYVPVTIGRHSTLNIDMTISWDHKLFHLGMHPTANLHYILKSDCVMAGPGVTPNSKNDLRVRKRSMNGEASFPDIRVSSVCSNMTFNFTQTLPYYPWERWPPQYNDNITFDQENLTMYTKAAKNMAAGVAITPPFSVTASPISTLQIDPQSLVSFGENIDANFPMKPDLIVYGVDLAGRVLTDGPDSALNVTVEIDPSSACLSVDSDFALSSGRGVFPGSVCRPAEGVRLRFTAVSANNTTVYSVWTPSFNVTGDLRMSFFALPGSVLLLFLYTTADLINDGVWGNDFKDQGRKFIPEVGTIKSQSINDSMTVYTDIYLRNRDPTKSSVRAIITTSTDAATVALSHFSTGHAMPLLGIATALELSNKAIHPFFNRISISEYTKWYAEGVYLASHYWTKIIMLKDPSFEVTSVITNAFAASGVEIVLEISVPALASPLVDYSTLRPMDADAEKIFAAGTKVIYSATFVPTLYYLIHEAIRLRFAPIHGFQWIGDYLSVYYFPFNNAPGTCMQDPTCTTAFNGTIMLFPQAEADLSGAYWINTLTKAYSHYDPTLHTGYTMWMWPSALSTNGLVHDAVVAIFLGAKSVIARNETLTGLKFAEAIRDVDFLGATGRFFFNENGDRPGYQAIIYGQKPVVDRPTIMSDFIFEVGIYKLDPITNEPTQKVTPLRYTFTRGMITDTQSYVASNYTNIRRFQGWVDGVSSLQTLEAVVPAAFYCREGCGGGLANDTNGTLFHYNHGTCVAMDTCVCKNKPNHPDEPGYAGRTCAQALCNPQCRNGRCVNPDECVCDVGWTNVDCSVPICNPECVHGTCTGPNICNCEEGYWGSSCAGVCTCVNGICNDGMGGTGTCSSCHGGWAGPNCDLSIPLVVVPTLFVTILIVVAIVVLAVWYIRRMRFMAALANNDWIVDYDDLIITQDNKNAASSMAFRSMVSMKGDEKVVKNVVRNQGKWKEHAVAIKMIDKDSITIDTPLRLEIKAIRELRHNNVAHFVGACCDSPNLCILMELAPKGSLDDLLANEAINLDWNFKFSLLKDICRGMQYISTSPIKSHGRLKASNCVVDNRWTLKITDYGLLRFKANQRGVPKLVTGVGIVEKGKTPEDMEEGETDYTIKQALLCTAPEILATGVTHPDQIGAGTIQGDMYSLGVIMSEILTKEPAYYEYLDYMEIDDVLDCIAGRKCLQDIPQAWTKADMQYLRPMVDVDEKEGEALVTVMEQCWAEDPNERPTFQTVLKQLNSISPQKGDLMDNLVGMLEKYSTNLEGIVAERTAELAAEKQKTEDLVCRMLPKAIAEQLKQGVQVAAETFECVTIYFSDIVGFTSIAGQSTPLQVVDLLNDLYTCFDAIIDHFDVYKVETIGDAYMVVSGLPIRNGDNHAGEIASMSLHLLSAILSFKIRHMPEKKLQLRIGLHSGPAVAGVVGLKMPRYCLFGDTVNTASRMESGGLALRIHMSESTAEILQRLGGYHVKMRGQREVKGKGIMTTYWLEGQDGFTRPLPTKEMAVSESQHEFK